MGGPLTASSGAAIYREFNEPGAPTSKGHQRQGKMQNKQNFLIIPASSASTCQLELQNIEGWADRNNLKLNRKNRVKLSFLDPGPTVKLKCRHPLLMALTGCNI